MTAIPLMPKATAVWLVDNTALTFEQIAEFCHLHPLEVKGIADGEVAAGIKGMDPVMYEQLTRDEIEKAEADSNYRLKLKVSSVRHDRPNAILWLVRSHPELKDAQIMRLVGTTKTTIQQVKDRTHWNTAQLQPMDPVTLGLCTQIDLDFEVNKASKDRPVIVDEAAHTLLPAEVTTARDTAEPFAGFSAKREEVQEEAIDVDSVFSKLKQLKTSE